MACGSCAGKRSNVEYEVVFKDGSTQRVATVGEARILAAQDASVDPSGRRRSATFRSVPRAKKTA